MPKTTVFLLVKVLFRQKEKVQWWAGPDSDRRPSARQADVLTRLDDRPTAILGCFSGI
jgi:hypothetical protein